MATGVFFGWRQVAVAFIVQGACMGAVISGYSVAMMPFAEAFEPSRTMLMLGMSASMIVSAVIAPFYGVLVERHSMRLMMLVGSIFLTAGYVALSMVTAMWQVLLIYGLIMSTPTTLLGPLAVNTLLARWFSRRRSLAIGVSAIGPSVGGFLLPPLLYLLIDTFEWRVAFRLLAVIMFVATTPWILMMVVSRPQERGLNPDGAATPSDAEGATGTRAGAAMFEGVRPILRDRTFWYIAVGTGTVFLVYTGLLTNLVPLATDRGISGERAAFLISLMSLAGIAGKLGFGAAGDRIDLRLLLGTVVVIKALALSAFVVAETYLPLAGAALLLGLAMGGMAPLWGSLIGQAFGVLSYSRALGLMTPVVAVMSLLSPPFAGYVHDVTGSYQVALITYVGLLLAILPLLPLIRLRLRPQRALEPEQVRLSAGS